MKRIAVIGLALGCGCGSKEPAKHPDDHELHRTDSADSTEIHGAGVDLAKVALSEWIPLPLSGTADIDLAIHTPIHDNARDYSHAKGSLEFHCESCRLGDDKTNIQITGMASGNDGIPFGHIDFARIDLRIAIVDGRVTVQRFELASNDLELGIVGTGELTTPLGESRIDACVRFKPTEALATRDPKTNAVIETTGAPRAKDGFYNIKLTDRVSSMKRLGVVCDGSVQD